MRLTETEKKVLSFIEIDARASVESIQKGSKLKSHSIRHAIDQLHQKKIITPQIWIDPSKLGLMHIFCFFSVSYKKKNSRNDLNDFLLKSHSVYWIAEIAGDHQYEIGLVVKSVEDAILFLNSIASRCGILIIRKEIFIRTDMVLYSRKYFSGQKRKKLELRKSKGINETLDKTDILLLKYLSHNPLISNREIAKNLSLSPGTINNRIGKMVTAGIIEGFWYLINSEALNRRMQYIQIFTRGFDANFSTQLEKFVFNNSNIIFLHKGLGAWDFQIHVETEKGEELSYLLDDINREFYSEINYIKVFTRLRILKCAMLGDVEIEQI